MKFSSFALVCFCLFLFVYVCCCPFPSSFVCFHQFLSLSVCFCPFLSVLSASVRFCLFWFVTELAPRPIHSNVHGAAAAKNFSHFLPLFVYLFLLPFIKAKSETDQLQKKIGKSCEKTLVSEFSILIFGSVQTKCSLLPYCLLLCLVRELAVGRSLAVAVCVRDR